MAKTRHLVFFCFAAAAGLSVRGDVLDNWHWRNPLPQGNELRGAGYANGRLVVVGDGGTLATSADAVTWTMQQTPTLESLMACTEGNGLTVAVGTNGTIITSADGITWRLCPTPTTNALFLP